MIGSRDDEGAGRGGSAERKDRPADDAPDPGRPANREAGASRDRLVERWLTLTRIILPSMAAEHHWPIVLDHCFMRVCLDETFGAPWTDTIARPAIRTMSAAQIAAAVATADAIVARPDLLVSLNRKSLDGRRVRRARE